MGYRNAYHQCFAPMDKYFTPFLVPHSKKGFSTKEKREVLPEHNQSLNLVPQIMSNQADDCIHTIEKLEQYGYKEININLGCPSKTVVSKRRGSGFLAYPEELRVFLNRVCEFAMARGILISVKTRLGKQDVDDFQKIMEIYEELPLSEVIIHPRIQTDFYKGHPRMEQFSYAYQTSRHDLCYNGDLFTVLDIQKLLSDYPKIDRVMLGRGILKNPFLVEWAKAEAISDTDRAYTEKELARLRNFHDRIFETYQKDYFGEANVLFKMKELWTFLGDRFPEYEKQLKIIRKAQHLDRYLDAVNEIFKY